MAYNVQFWLSLSFFGDDLPLSEDIMDKIIGIKGHINLAGEKASSKANKSYVYKTNSWHSEIFYSNKKNGLNETLQIIVDKLLENKNEINSLIHKTGIKGRINISMDMSPFSGWEVMSPCQMNALSNLNIEVGICCWAP